MLKHGALKVVGSGVGSFVISINQKIQREKINFLNNEAEEKKKRNR